MHKLLEYKRQINKTHRGLGNMYAFSLVASKARKVCVLVAIAGSGKTTVMNSVKEQNKEKHLSLSSMTRSGLKQIQKEFYGFKGTLVIEDLGNVDTSYSLLESVKTAIALAYDHGLTKLNSQLHLEIRNFFGGVLTSIQPEIMPTIITSPSWEAVIRDKALRYYHLIRATKVNNTPIVIKADWGKDLDSIRYVRSNNKRFKELMAVFLDQFGLTRAEQHLTDMLKASAALDGREEVNATDLNALLEITRPMRLEKYVIYKEGIAGLKYFKTDDVYTLTEFATYGIVTIAQLMTDWSVSRRTVNRLLQMVDEYWLPNPKNTNELHPSDETKQILKECGYN